MKCPQCGFVSYGLDQCSKCHYPFAPAAAKGSTSLHPSNLTEEFDHEFDAPAEPPSLSELEPESAPSLQFDSTEPVEPEKSGASAANWREELSDRLVSFRKRRGIPAPEKSLIANLELEFGSLHPEDEPEPLLRSPTHPAADDSNLDMELGGDAEPQSNLTFDQPPARSLELHLDADPAEGHPQMLFGEPVKSAPMEILVNSPGRSAGDEVETVGHFYAPLQRRFVAGLADAAFLLAGAAIFGGIFWFSMTRFCDHNTLAPFSLGIIGLIALMVIFSYFAIFTALSFATPGMLWAGCEVRNLHGDHPTVNESLWRAFGVVISISALMVGFIWAYVDSETLPWHDRMSGTVITDAKVPTPIPRPAES